MQNLYLAIIINISLLILLATILTKMVSAASIFFQEQQMLELREQLLLGLTFGLFCIFSTCTGTKVQGAIQNTRVLSVLTAALLGGPISGMSAAIIGAFHRFIYDPDGFSTLACSLSTFLDGILGSVVWELFRRHNRKQTPLSLFSAAAAAGAMEMLLILAIARPFSAARSVVELIAVPMILCNSLGMILFFGVFTEEAQRRDLLAANRIRMALNIADECIPYIRKNPKTPEDYNRMAAIISSYKRGTRAIFFHPDRTTRLNDCSEPVPADIFSDTRTLMREIRHKNIYCAPLTQEGTVWAYLVLIIRNDFFSARADLDFVTGLARFFSRNYEAAQIETQKKLLQRAEFQALQLQINPHFLFNSLNTIAYFCREKPERARELILSLSVYFRNTLISTDDYMIPLQNEIDHVKAYTELEQARFEDRLEVYWELTPCDIRVPTLILQPIVENAIKHGAMRRKKGIVRIRGSASDDSLTIYVEDNGPGFSAESLNRFKTKQKNQHYGLQNVDARLRTIYGEENGLLIQTDENGTCIEMHFRKL